MKPGPPESLQRVDGMWDNFFQFNLPGLQAGF